MTVLSAKAPANMNGLSAELRQMAKTQKVDKSLWLRRASAVDRKVRR